MKRGFVVSILVLATSAPSACTPTSTPAAAAPTAAPASAPVEQGVKVSGRVLGHDGEPLRQGRIEITRNGFKDKTVELVLGDDGSFEGRLPDGGAWFVRMTGVDHAEARKTVLVTDALRIEGRLGTYDRAEPKDTLALMVQFLDANDDALGNPAPLKAAKKDDVFVAMLPKAPEGATAVRYQLTDLAGGRTFNGPGGERWAYDGGGDYWAIVDLGDTPSLRLDPKAMSPVGVKSQLAWSGIDAEADAIATQMAKWGGEITDVLQASRERSPKTKGPDAKATKALDELRARARAEVDAADASEQTLRRLAWLCDFAPFLSDDELRTQVEWMLSAVEPTDPKLPLFHSLNLVVSLGYRKKLGLDEKLAAFVDAEANAHPDAGLVVDALGMQMWQAEQAHDQARVDELFARVKDPRFAGTYAQERLLHTYDPNRVLKPGNVFPAFDFPGIPNPKTRVTKADHDGTLYLVEFWATWCGPCREEMPTQHAAYAEINGMKVPSDEKRLRKLKRPKQPRVEFVFLSFDAAPDDVIRYRKEHWSMPWVHAIVPPDQREQARERFGFSGIPTAVLLDETGKIIATRDELRDEELLPTLREALAAQE